MTRVPDAHFVARYAADPDPWGLEGSWYERRKYLLTVAALPRRRYARAFEPGCSIGLLTELLAPRCDRLLAMDPSPQAVAAAGRRCADLPGVELRRGAVPDGWPADGLDLIVLSEMAYYLAPDGLDAVLDRAVGSLAAGGHLVAVHYRPDADEHLQSGDDVHARLRGHSGLRTLATYVEPAFRLDVLEVDA